MMDLRLAVSENQYYTYCLSTPSAPIERISLIA